MRPHVCRAAILALLISCFAVQRANAQADGGSNEKKTRPHVVRLEWSAANERIFRALEQPAHFDLLDAPLPDVAEEIERQHKIPVMIDSRALTDIGLGKPAPVTLQVKGVTLKSGLRLMLRQLDLSYTVVDEVVLITSPEVAESKLVTRIYPVSDLLDYSHRTLARRNKQAESRGKQTARRVGPATIYQGITDRDDFETTITAPLAPASWEEVGGAGVVRMFGDLLIVSHTLEMHERVAALLDGLRRAAGIAPSQREKSQEGAKPEKRPAPLVRIHDVDPGAPKTRREDSEPCPPGRDDPFADPDIEM